MESAVHGRGPSGEFDLRPVIARSRELLKGTKRYAFALWVTFAVGGLVIDILLGHGLGEPRPGSFVHQIVSEFWAAIMILAHTTFGLLVVAEKRLTFGALFRHLDRLPAILIVSLPMNLSYVYLEALWRLGPWTFAWLLLIPVAFWPFYVVDRGMGPLEAVGSSYSFVLRNLGAYLLFLLLGMGLIVAAALTLGIGLVWLLPFFAIAPAVMFASAEGLEGTYDA